MAQTIVRVRTCRLFMRRTSSRKSKDNIVANTTLQSKKHLNHIKPFKLTSIWMQRNAAKLASETSGCAQPEVPPARWLLGWGVSAGYEGERRGEGRGGVPPLQHWDLTLLPPRLLLHGSSDHHRVWDQWSGQEVSGKCNMFYNIIKQILIN